MTFQQIFDYFGINSYNLAELPSVAKALIEIERIESLRRNNANAKDVKIQALGNHGIWQPKRLIIPSALAKEHLHLHCASIHWQEVDALYDHIVLVDAEISSLNLSTQNGREERYIHSYLQGDNKDKIVTAPLGVKLSISNSDIIFVQQFIAENLADMDKYQLA